MGTFVAIGRCRGKIWRGLRGCLRNIRIGSHPELAAGGAKARDLQYHLPKKLPLPPNERNFSHEMGEFTQLFGGYIIFLLFHLKKFLLTNSASKKSKSSTIRLLEERTALSE